MTVLVVGATGLQGGATARALLAAGVPVRALVRDPGSPRAAEIAALGATLYRGDLRDPASLTGAVAGVRAVFSVQMPAWNEDGSADFDDELRQAVNLIDAAAAGGVEQFVQTSVSGAGRHAGGRWAPMDAVYRPKILAAERIRAVGFPRWTLLKPAFFMTNLHPATAYLFPRGVEGGLATVLKPGTHLSLVAVDDIGRAAAAAFTDPGRFDRVELELASDYRTMTEIAATLSRALGTPIAAPDMTEAEALAAGMPPYAVLSHAFLDAVGQPARPEFARALGIPLTSFETWANSAL
ncbi:uncharacterized protein YbjT (DUF2867 family) [Catenuloplanes nepalensis]|uniref:Uncharacterized protein YbjT (DUF2867 family) n=1 Tax=Catenuloplanes nepalensis TaxID=587533 RepID=A0ABT9MVH1_9ACTN|nr:NmrA/HSCARG family protein [Catenuloplanes nepalensis]MDP9795433.1 uncharacterized protein YbjT (DUF2867 family) [Catenuloplanes nepalensis]